MPGLGGHETQFPQAVEDRLHGQCGQQDAQNSFGHAKRLRVDEFQDPAFKSSEVIQTGQFIKVGIPE